MEDDSGFLDDDEKCLDFGMEQLRPASVSTGSPQPRKRIIQGKDKDQENNDDEEDDIDLVKDQTKHSGNKDNDDEEDSEDDSPSEDRDIPARQGGDTRGNGDFAHKNLVLRPGPEAGSVRSRERLFQQRHRIQAYLVTHSRH
ncbi:hypothetical protein CDD83_4483 [Cordyceps sp. RAO-2017]|nr:hypothetical protein CDD83_4483 [Cordyceps sp. RAO-2017]